MLTLAASVHTYRTMKSDHHPLKIGVEPNKKPRLLCLHGFRTSGDILKKQLDTWPNSVRQKLDLVFPDGSFPAQGKSNVDGIYDPPYYEWFQFSKGYKTVYNYENCVEYVEECMIKHGPIDGFLGFSQGAVLSAALPGMQEQGYALTKVPKVKFVIIIGGGCFKFAPWNMQAYGSPIACPSLHFIGKRDYLRPYGEDLLEYYAADPVVIRCSNGHTIPPIDDQALPTVLTFLDKIQKLVSEEKVENIRVSNI